MRVLLVDPPYDRLRNSKTTPNYPLGLAYLVAYLEKQGHEAVYLNLDWDESLPSSNPFSRVDMAARQRLYRQAVVDPNHAVWQDFREALRVYKPDIVGISTSSVKIKSAFRLLEETKKADPKLVTIFGGYHSNVYYRELMENVPGLDFTVLDEGELTLHELVDELARPADRNFGKIQGLVFRDGSGQVRVNERRPLIGDLDSLPFPAPCKRFEKGRFLDIPVVALMSSRGCPYDCHYCASKNVWKRKVRVRSPRNVVDEIKLILSKQKSAHFSFYDDCFTLNKKWLVEFCDLFEKEKLGANWQCITSVNLIDEEILKRVCAAGCIKMNVAIESGSERILEVANKRNDLEKIRRIFRLAKQHDISVTAYSMLGFPSETEEDIRLTQRIITETAPNWVYCNVLVPLPSTPFLDWAVEKGLTTRQKAWNGDLYDEPYMNLTGTIPDDRFYALVDETFQICYKTNTRVSNLLKRIPFKSYLRNPADILRDAQKLYGYVRRRAVKG